MSRALNDPAFLPTFIGIVSNIIGLIAAAFLLYAAKRYGNAIHWILDPPDGEGPGKHGRPLHMNLYILECLGLFGLLYLGWQCVGYLTIGRCWYRENGRRKTIRLRRELVPTRWKIAILVPGYIAIVMCVIFCVSGALITEIPR